MSQSSVMRATGLGQHTCGKWMLYTKTEEQKHWTGATRQYGRSKGTDGLPFMNMSVFRCRCLRPRTNSLNLTCLRTPRRPFTPQSDEHPVKLQRSLGVGAGENPSYGFTERFRHKRRIRSSAFNNTLVLTPSRPHQAALATKTTGCTNIVGAVPDCK